MNTKDYIGKLIAVDMYGCDEEKVNNPELVLEKLEQACEEFNMQAYRLARYDEPESDVDEYCISAICKRGHVTLHIHPSIGMVTADVFSCYPESHPAHLSRAMRAFFNADKSKITVMQRVDFGDQSDMKPKRNSSMKFIRRTKGIGRKLKKLFSRPKSM